MKKEELIERAQELNISVPDGSTNDQIKDLIKIAEHDLLTEQVSDLTNKLSDSESEKDALQKKLDAKPELKVESKATGGDGKLPTYKHDGDTYQFTVNNILAGGKKIKAEEAVVNKDLMSSLIESKFFGLKKL